jgi:hypothetical protein
MLAGGRISDDSISDGVVFYDPVTRQFEIGASLPFARDMATIVTISDRVGIHKTRPTCHPRIHMRHDIDAYAL